MKQTAIYIVGIFLSLSLAGCGVSHRGSRASSSGELGAEAYSESRLRSQLSAPSQRKTLRGAMTVDLQLGKENFSSRVNTTIVQGEGIYWSVVPFPLVEAGRVWFTPSGVTVVDRIHGRYAEATNRELSDYLGFPLGYTEIEALLTGQPFLPEAARERSVKALVYRVHEGGGAELAGNIQSTSSGDGAAYTFRWSFTKEGFPELFDVWHKDAAKGRIFALRYRPNTESEGVLPALTEFFLGKDLNASPKLIIDWTRVQPYTGSVPSLTPHIKDSYKRIAVSDLLRTLAK